MTDHVAFRQTLRGRLHPRQWNQHTVTCNKVHCGGPYSSPLGHSPRFPTGARAVLCLIRGYVDSMPAQPVSFTERVSAHVGRSKALLDEIRRAAAYLRNKQLYAFWMLEEVT